MWFTSTCGRIELQITKQQAASCSHPGPCDSDVAALRNHPKIRRQLDKLDPETVRKELREMTDYSQAALQDHQANLSRILWIACNEITENCNTH